MSDYEDNLFAGSAPAQGGEQSTLSEVAADAWSASGLGGEMVSNFKRTEAAIDERIDAVFKATGQRLINPMRINQRDLQQRLGTAQTTAEIEAIRTEATMAGFQRRLRQLADEYPHHYSVIDPERDPRRVAGDRKRADEEKLASSLERSPWTWSPNIPGLGPTPINPAALGSGFVQGFTDPINIGTMALFGGPAGQGAMQVIWGGTRAAAANAATDAAAQPFVQTWRRDAGLDYGWDNAKHSIAASALFGFTVDAGGRTAWRGVRAYQGRVPILDADGKVTGYQPAPDAPLVPGAAAAAADAPDLPPVRDAAFVAERERLAREEGPEAALDHAARNAPEGSLLRRAAEGDEAATIELARASGAADADPAVRGALQDLERAKLFGAPPEVPTLDHYARLADAIQRSTDPDAPPVAGSRPVAAALDPATLTPERAALRQRLVDQVGEPVELARIMRTHPDLVTADLHLGDNKMARAADLARLSDAAFAKVEAGAVKANHAALVARHIDDPSQHVRAVDAIAAAGLRNIEAVKAFLADFAAKPGDVGPHRARLGAHGLDPAQMAVRAGVLDAGLKGLVKSADIKALIERDAVRVEAGLPEAQRGDKKLRAELGKRLAALIDTLARSDSHVAELLADATQAQAGGVSKKMAAQAFVGRIAQVLEADGVDGLAKPRRAERIGRGIDDPFGPEAQAQTKALAERVKFSVRGGEPNQRGGDGRSSGRDGQTGAGGREAPGSAGRAPAQATRAGQDGGAQGRRTGQFELPRNEIKHGAPVGHFGFDGKHQGTIVRETIGDQTYVSFFLHDKKAKLPPLDHLEATDAHEAIGVANKWIANVDLEERTPGRFEVANLRVRAGHRGKGVATKLYDTIEREFGITLAPSGQLTKDGFGFWSNRQPGSTAHHRWDSRATMYYSPKMLGAFRAMADAAGDVEAVKHYQGLLDTIPAEAKTPDALRQMFSIRDPADIRRHAGPRWQQIRTEIDKIINRLPKGVRVEMLDRLVFGGRDINGMWDPYMALVRIAMEDGADRVLRHEEIHVLRDLRLLSEREFEVLVARGLRDGLMEKFDIEARYTDVYADRFDGDPHALRAAQLEEMVAEMWANHRRGERYDGLASGIFRRLTNFAEAIRNAVTGHGFQSADQIFRRIETGQVAQREPATLTPPQINTTPAARPAGQRPRLSVGEPSRPLALPDDFAPFLGFKGQAVKFDAEAIAAKRAEYAEKTKTAIQPEVATPVAVRALIEDVLANATMARQYHDGAWNLLRPLPDGTWALVSVKAKANGHGFHEVKTAYIMDAETHARSLSGSLNMFGEQGMRLRGDDPEALRSGLASVSEANKVARGQPFNSIIASLEQRLAIAEGRLGDPAEALHAHAERVDLMKTLAEACKK